MAKQYTQRDVASEVTASIIATLEEGLKGGAWKRPWRTVTPAGGSNTPLSIRGRSYRGMNQFILMIKAQANGWENVWGTFSGFKQAGAQVRKGERGTLVTLWKFIPVKDKVTGKDKTIPIVKGFTLFSTSQVDNWEKTTKPREVKPLEVVHREAHETLAKYLDREGVGFNEGGDRAFYRESDDAITMPEHRAFKTDADYIGTLAHEAGHSTGHTKRLDRKLLNRFGDEAYAFEELVAELSATFTLCSLGVEQPEELDEQHAAYLLSWLKTLRGDKGAILKAAGLAQRATDLVLNISFENTAESEGDEAKAA